MFDRFGHLLEEASASGAVQKEYIWLDDMPVAIVDDTGTTPVLYYIQTDQLGSPQKITDANANLVWDGVFDPFGNAQSTSNGGGVWDSSLWDNFLWGASLSLTNLRFPGQYADAETALNQNWFRDYDPTIGRYTQSDPTELHYDPDTYAYVESPLIFVDDDGLARSRALEKGERNKTKGGRSNEQSLQALPTRSLRPELYLLQKSAHGQREQKVYRCHIRRRPHWPHIDARTVRHARGLMTRSPLH